MATLKVPDRVGDLGSYLKEQRETARLSIRQLASAAGVSNPYLSQIERGLRRPSAEVLQQIAKGLQISAEALFLRAGLLEDPRGLEVEAAIHSDVHLSSRQKRVLLDIYSTFRAENGRLEESAVADAVEAAIDGVTAEPAEEQELPKPRRPRRSSAAKKTRAAKKVAAQEEPDDPPVVAATRKSAGRAPRKRAPRTATGGDAAAGS